MWWVNLASYTFILIIGAPKYSRTINNTVSHIEQNFQSNNSKYLYGTYCVSGIIPGFLHRLIHLIPTMTPWGMYRHDFQFNNTENED